MAGGSDGLALEVDIDMTVCSVDDCDEEQDLSTVRVKVPMPPFGEWELEIPLCPSHLKALQADSSVEWISLAEGDGEGTVYRPATETYSPNDSLAVATSLELPDLSEVAHDEDCDTPGCTGKDCSAARALYIDEMADATD